MRGSRGSGRGSGGGGHRSVPRLQRQTSVLHEIQETQEKENLETRYARLMMELSGLCGDRNNVLTTESLEFLASDGRPEPVKLERELEKVVDVAEKALLAGKKEDLLSADAARRQRVEELTRFFMEAKSDIEFALGGGREQREKEKDTDAERDDDKGTETGDDEEDTEKVDDTPDPARDAARLHVRLLKEKIDDRVYTNMLSQIREKDAALYGAILCHPLVTGVDPKKDKRKKKKRKDRERKDKTQVPPSLNSMLSPDFSAPALGDDEMKTNIARFVARAIADGSVQGLLLASKLLLAWIAESGHTSSETLMLPLVTHLRVLRGEMAPAVPTRPALVKPEQKATAEPKDDRPGQESNVGQVNSDSNNNDGASSVAVDMDTESDALANLRARLSRFGDVNIDHGRIGDEGDDDDAESGGDEGVDEDALMARAIALSLSPEMNLRDQGEANPSSSPASLAELPSPVVEEAPARPATFSPDEIIGLGPFLLPKDGLQVSAVGVVMCLIAQVNRLCLDYLESCQKGVLPNSSFIQPHPLTFMLINSVLRDLFSTRPSCMFTDNDIASWKLFESCSKFSMFRVLEAHFFHVEVVGVSPASVGLGQFTTQGELDQPGLSNKLVESLKNLVECSFEGDCTIMSTSAENIDEVGSIIYNCAHASHDVERVAKLYENQVREYALAAWARGIAYFYPSQTSRHHLLVSKLQHCMSVPNGEEINEALKFHQLDLLCARLSLMDLAQFFVPICGDVLVGDSETQADTINGSNSKMVDDSEIQNTIQKGGKPKPLWSPELIRRSIGAGSLTSRCLLDFVIGNSTPDFLDSAGISTLVLGDERADEVLSNAYELLWNTSRREEEHARECINRLPIVIDLLRESVLRESWPNFSIADDYSLPHAPLVPLLEQRKKSEMAALNARILLLRALQDLMIVRISGSRGNDPPALEFDPTRCAETMTLSDGNVTARQYTAKQWGMVMSTTGCPPNSGVHEWAVRLDRCEKGHIFLGVCTRDASVATYVGGDRQGWGLIGTRALWHNRSKVRGDYGEGFSTGSIVRVRLNTDSGALSFGVDDSDWGIAFDGLTQHGMLFPAIGLYQRDDQVTMLTVRQSDNSPPVGGMVRAASIPAIVHPFLHHSAAIINAVCKFLQTTELQERINQDQAAGSNHSVGELVAEHPLLRPLLIPLVSGLSIMKNFHGLSSIMALQFIPWCTKLVQLLDTITRRIGSIRSQSGGDLGLDISGEWELKSMASGNIPAQQYHLILTQEADGVVSGRSSGSFTSVTLNGALLGTKVRFVETWRQGGTCLVEGRLRADGTAFSGCYEDTKSHTSGSIYGHKLRSSTNHNRTGVAVNGLVILEVICANMVGFFSRALVDGNKPDVVLEDFSSVATSDEEIVSDGPSAVNADDTPKMSSECSSDEYETWVNSLLLSGGLPPSIVKIHLTDVLDRLTQLANVELVGGTAFPILATASREWLAFVTPKAASTGIADDSCSGAGNDFLRDIINAHGRASALDRWVSRHVGESPFMRLGGEPMKLAKRTVCAAMIWHSGSLDSISRVLEDSPDNLVDSEQRPHDNLMHIWRAAQRVIEWGIRAKNSMGSTYAVIAGLVIRKAQFLLTIEPSPKALAASSAVSILSQDLHSGGGSSRVAVYECAERIYSEVLMQVSRFLEAPIRISSLQARMLTHSTRACLRIIGMLSFRFFVGDSSGPGRSGSRDVVQSSFAISSALQWLSPGAVDSPSVVASSKDASDNLDITPGGPRTPPSSHYLSGRGGCGKHLKNDLRDAFEVLYGYLGASLSKATWGHDTDLQLVVLEAWGIVILPDDHSFLSRVGIFRIIQTVLDEARSSDTPVEAGGGDICSSESRAQLVESRRKVVQAALKAVHLLAAQVANAGDVDDALVASVDSSSSNNMGLGAIPLLRKPSGPETLGKSVFHMLYTELKNALEDVRSAGNKSSNLDVRSNHPAEPTEAEPNISLEDFSDSDDAEEYCYQICSLLYSVSGSPVCRSHLSSSRWLRLLLVLLELSSVRIQRRTLKLLRRLLPELDPTSIKLRPDAMDMLDVDSDDDDDADDAEDQAAALIRFFVGIVGSICPPSLAEAMLRRMPADAGKLVQPTLGVEPNKNVGHTGSLAGEVVLLLRSLYFSPKWADHLSFMVVKALSMLPDACTKEPKLRGDGADSDVEMEDMSREVPSVSAWASQNNSYLEALSALCVLDGHVDGLHVGGTVKILPKATHTNQDISVRGSRGIVISYDPEKSAAEVLIQGTRGGDTPPKSTIGTNRPVRVPVDDLVPVPDVDLDTAAFSDDVLQVVLVNKFKFFVDEIKKSLVDLKHIDTMKSICSGGDVDEDDDMSNDEPSSPRGMESETTAGRIGESDGEEDLMSPRLKKDTSGAVEPTEVLSEMEKESKLHRMLLCQHGMRAAAMLLRDERAATTFIQGSGPTGLTDLLEIAVTETPTAGLSEITSLEESWMILWSRWFSERQAGASPIVDNVVGDGSTGNTRDEDKGPSPIVQQMMEMGFPKEWCDAALARCSQNVEAAINFCFEHSNDMERLVAQHKASTEASRDGSRSRTTETDIVSPLLEQLAEMGFPLNWCKKALAANRNNVDAALTWILSNGEALEAEDRQDEDVKQQSGGERDSIEDPISLEPARPNPLRAVSGQASIGENDMMVEGLVGGGFASVGAPDCLVSSGRWYYEATLHTNGCIQIGWADVAFCGAAERGDGVGDGAHSWAYDGWRQQKWHGQSSPWGSKWKQGDVVGCAVDADAGSIIFSLNGKMRSANMGIAFRGVEFAHGVYPCASFNRRERLQFNMGGSPFKYAPPPGFRPILEVLCTSQETIDGLPSGFEVLGCREDCLEEGIGEENYSSDARYFGRDLHPSMVRSSGGHARGSILIGNNRADMIAELKAIPDERVFMELLLLTRTLAVLHARRALLTLLAKWPHKSVGRFSVGRFLPIESDVSDDPGRDADVSRLIDFIKLIAGLSGGSTAIVPVSNGMIRSSDTDDLLDYGAYGRQGLNMLFDVTRSALDEALSEASSATISSQIPVLRVFLLRISNEIQSASERQYARVPWDSSDALVMTSFLQISSESGQPWCDKEVLKHPNLFLAEWASRLLLESLSRLQENLSDEVHNHLRSELLKAWVAALKSPGLCVKEKAFAIVAGILQDMLVKVSIGEALVSSEKKGVVEDVLNAFSVRRLVDLAEDRLFKEYAQMPVCSRYLQSVVELVTAASLASSFVGLPSDELFSHDIAGRLNAAKKLESDLFEVDTNEYAEEMENVRRLTAEAELKAKEAGAAEEVNESTATVEGAEDQQMQDDGNSTPRQISNVGSNMEVDSESEETPDITLSAIADMVAEDSDVVAAAAAIAAAGRGRTTGQQDEKIINDTTLAQRFEYSFPEEKIVFDTSILNQNELLMLEAGVEGILGDEDLSWHYGSETGILSDTSTNIWSGQVTQHKLCTDEGEPTTPELNVGCKVVRGPNWKWRDQDGGEGSIGVVEGVSPWSGVDGEGMSVRWPNDSLYTYRWGADGNYDLIHVEVDEGGSIVTQHPTPKVKLEDEGSFGCELHLGVLLHLFPESDTWKDGAMKVSGLMEWPDFGAAVLVVGLRFSDSSLCIQELQMTRGSPDMGWLLRFGVEKWQPGTKYMLHPVMPSVEGAEPDMCSLQGTYSHMARQKGTLVKVQGTIRLSTKHLFTMDPYNHFSTLTVSDGGMTVTCNSGESRNLALGTVGFASGVHYWEVRVDQAEFGSVFIGVCEKAGPPGSQAALSSRLNRWHGWGFVNFRATYHNSTERIYGDHFNAGDTIGVRLDMEQGKLSFFMDGMKFGEHIVADLGVAFENMKGERNSRTLYPCIGMRKSGDRVALNEKWISLPGVSSRQLLRDAVDVGSSLHAWYVSMQAPQPTPVTVSERLLSDSWYEWKRWNENRWQRAPVRPRGVLVDFDTYPTSCVEVSKAAGLEAPFLAGDRVRICSKYGRELNQPEEAVILGVYRGYLWYRTETQGTEGADEGRAWAWYFLANELPELLLVKRNGKDMTLIENSATDLSEAMATENVFTPRSSLEARALNDFAAFVELATRSHTPSSDMQLVERLNMYCTVIGVDVTNLKIKDVILPDELEVSSETHSDSAVDSSRPRTHSLIPDQFFSTPALKSISGPELRARCALLRVLNGKIERTLPMVALHSADKSKDAIGVAKRGSDRRDKSLGCAEYPSTSFKLRSLRRLIFTSTKLSFWDAVVRATTTTTPLPSDEYEDPREIRIIRINRIQAQPSKLSLLAQPSDRLRRSVFGQLYREMRTWNDSSFRRAYCGKGHGGQRRAFKVKFLGEGVNDYGGPYRAVFEQIIDELQMDNVELSKGEHGLLSLMIPCPNRRSGTGGNQDKFMLNPTCGTSLGSSGPMALDLYRFLGKMIGTAVRHGLQMGLDLPSLVWRPLAALEVGRANLESVDVVWTNNLSRVEECREENAEEVLEYLTLSTTLSDGTEVPLCSNGENVPVTIENKTAYVELSEQTRLTESAQQLAALRDGLGAVLPMELAPLFTPRELEVLICGRREVDVDLLQQCTEYLEGVDESLPHVQAFWEVLKEMTTEERTSFLRFVWARSRMPNSAKDFPMNFKIQAAHDSGAQVDPDKYLPHAQTCFFALRLPSYTSKDILRKKLLYAIQNSPNMDADVRLHNAEGWADA